MEISVNEAQNNLADLITRVMQGESIIIQAASSDRWRWLAAQVWGRIPGV